MQPNNPPMPSYSQKSNSLLDIAQASGIKPAGKPQANISQQPQQEQDGFLKSLVKGAAKPFLEVGSTVNNVGNAIGSLVKGGFNQDAVNQANKDLHQTYNLPFFGVRLSLA
jgi:hypothetical protein